MFGLLLCAVLAERMQPGVISQAATALFARTDRTYKESPDTFLGQLLITLFRIGTFSMTLCLCLFTDTHTPFAAFWAVCGLILAVFIGKMLCNVLLNYTFGITRRHGDAYEPYGNMITLTAMTLYPLLLVLTYIGNTAVSRWTTAIVVALSLAVWTYRSARTYCVSPMAVLYLAAYIATLEIVPLAATWFLSDKLITTL